jgi:hypothetical protein
MAGRTGSPTSTRRRNSAPGRTRALLRAALGGPWKRCVPGRSWTGCRRSDIDHRARHHAQRFAVRAPRHDPRLTIDEDRARSHRGTSAALGPTGHLGRPLPDDHATRSVGAPRHVWVEHSQQPFEVSVPCRRQKGVDHGAHAAARRLPPGLHPDWVQSCRYLPPAGSVMSDDGSGRAEVTDGEQPSGLQGVAATGHQGQPGQSRLGNPDTSGAGQAQVEPGRGLPGSTYRSTSTNPCLCAKRRPSSLEDRTTVSITVAPRDLQVVTLRAFSYVVQRQQVRRNDLVMDVPPVAE